MSIHAGIEAILRTLPPIDVERLKQAKAAKAPAPVTLFEAATEGEVQSVKDVVCRANDATCSRPLFMKDLCLNESVKTGVAPKFACDGDWINQIGIKTEDEQKGIKSFVVAFDSWEAVFMDIVHNFIKDQEDIKTKVNVAVPLSFRLEKPDGGFIDTVYFREDVWNLVFGKLMATTKVSKITLWLILWVLQESHPDIAALDQNELQPICNFAARSTEVRSDSALSALKVAYDAKLFTAVTRKSFEIGGKDPDVLHVFATSMKYGNPHYITNLLLNKAKVAQEAFTEEAIVDALFLAMHDEKMALFDYIANNAAIKNIAAKYKLFLFKVALNCVQTRNNDAYLFKWMLSSEQKWPDVCDNNAVALKLDADHRTVLTNLDQRVALRNPLIAGLSMGTEEEREAFLKRVGRTASKTVPAIVAVAAGGV